MQFLTEFDRAFIINLPERADRRRQMETMLAKINVPLVPGRIDFFPGIRPAAANGFPSIGARGCFLSHLEVLKRARAEGVRRLLVMEDDLQIDPLSDDQALRCLECLRSQHWDLLYLGHVLELNSDVSFACGLPGVYGKHTKYAFLCRQRARDWPSH